MQTLIKVSIILLLFAFLGKMCYKSCTKEIILRGIVISHATTSSKTGNITYYLLVMKVIYLFKFNNSEQILSVDVPDNATIDEINAIIFQNNNEWIAREYKSEWEILPHGENPHSAESLAFAQLLAKIACKIDKIESGMRDGLKELNNMLAEANCLSEYPSIPTEYKEDLQSLVSFPAILKSALVQCRHKQSDYPTPAQLLQFFE